MQRSTIKDLATVGLLMGLVTVSTLSIRVPIPATGGMIHIGDSMIFLTAILFGRKKGALAGGVGSALANFLAGYSQWILATFIIKSLMGYIVGTIADQQSNNIVSVRNVAAMLVGTLWMTAGYYVAGGFMVGFQAAWTGVPWDIVQGVGGAVLFVPVGIALKRTGYFKRYVLS